MAVLYWLTFYSMSRLWKDSVAGEVFLLIAPAAAPILAALLLDMRGELSFSGHIKVSLLVIAVLTAAAFLFLREGGVCVVMLFPLYLLIGVSGAAVIGTIRRRGLARRISSCIVLMPFVALPIEQEDMRPAQVETVVSAIEIAAPPWAVWRNVVAVPNIRPSELTWTFTQDLLGVPKPMDARLEGRGVGAVRHVTWGHGIHFEERITDWKENRYLAWNFHFDSNSIPSNIERRMSPDSGFLKVQAGSYSLEALPNGHTRLVLRTRYWERTALNDYCAWWGRVFIGDFHRNVLHVIQRRSETG